MVRQLSQDRARAKEILAQEILAVIKRGLERKGYTLEESGLNKYMISSGGSQFAQVKCYPGLSKDVALHVHVPGLMPPPNRISPGFIKTFDLHKTESPKKTTALVIRFLRDAQVKLVMQS